jgi:hypothetical protein
MTEYSGFPQARSRVDPPGRTDLEPWRTVYTLDFGDDGSTSFSQDGDGTDPDDGEPWPTGLWIEPDCFDVTVEEPHEGDDPGPERENPEQRRFYRELFALGKRWRGENESFVDSGGPLPCRTARETELRALYERYAARHPGRIATAGDRPAEVSAREARLFLEEAAAYAVGAATAAGRAGLDVAGCGSAGLPAALDALRHAIRIEPERTAQEEDAEILQAAGRVCAAYTATLTPVEVIRVGTAASGPIQELTHWVGMMRRAPALCSPGAAS